MNLVDVVTLSKKLCPQPIQVKLKYANKENFLGRIVNGYVPGVDDIALLTPKAANDLCLAQNELINKFGYGLLVYDAYRPKRAVQDFLQWSKQLPADDDELERKAKHYPHIRKDQLFELGYVMEDSDHCYGNTVDVVLIELSAGKKLDMGARFDYMDELSHITATAAMIGEEACKNRQILSAAMMKFGFQTYTEEYWHFCHGGAVGREVREPMDVEINSEMRDIR